MSFLFFIKTRNVRLFTKCVQLKVCIPKQFFPNRKCSSTTQELHKCVPDKLQSLSFADMLKERNSQAKRSILVQVQSAKSYKELYSYCNSLGSVKEMSHYCTGLEPMHFIIVEFENESDVSNILSRSSFIEDHQVVPVQSSFLWFSAPSKKIAKLKQSNAIDLSVENGTTLPVETNVKESLKNSDSISTQMRLLYNSTKLSDTGVRLRFLLAKQIESAIAGMFPYATAIPFGSSVNGYGKMGCDLDIVLRLSERKERNDDSRLIFHCKASNGSERSTSQRHMESIGDLLQLFLPGCSQVRRILQARVPIIKYYQQLADVECDLSMANLSGVYMSDFLYMMGSYDDRVRPLVCTIRKWAQAVGLTNSSPGRWISNFSLTLLVLGFLQKPLDSPPILPSLNTLVKLAGPDDKYITEDGINCTFIRDITKVTLPKQNPASLEALLKQFFEYYSQFDFSTRAISLNEGSPITKPEYSALYIVNPLERGLNVSKNVSLEELDKFRLELRNAAWLLQSDNVNAEETDWGILPLFVGSNKKKSFAQSFPMTQQSKKLIDVSSLFDEGESEESVVDIKSEGVRQQVQQIKRETKANIKALEGESGGGRKVNRQKLKR